MILNMEPWVNSSHQSWSNEYNKAWQSFFETNNNPTFEQVKRFASDLANKYGFTINF